MLFLARQNIAFTGTSSNIHDESGKNGNFQQLVHTVAEFDLVLKEHLERNQKFHYMSPQTQNELIDIIGKKIQTEILNRIKKSKYFSIILDSTPDITRLEQMSLVVRYVHSNESTQRYEVNESFIKFLNIVDKTGMGIAEAAIAELISFNLDLDDLRGQGYDNGASMKGRNIGVQRQILDKYPRAFFVSCANHSLNWF